MHGHLGKKRTPEQIEARRQRQLGRKLPPCSEERKRKISESNKGKQRTEETRLKLGLSHLGQKAWNKGKRQSEEHRRKNSESHRGKRKPHSEITKEKIRLTKLGEKNPMYGKTPSNKGKSPSREARRKMSESRKGRIVWNKGRKLTIQEIQRLKDMRSKQIFPLKDTTPEKIIQSKLNDLGMSFETHRSFRIRDFNHQVDIFIETNICIECDGDFWHSRLINGRILRIKRDFVIGYELEKRGYKVIRLWKWDIEHNLDWCIKMIKSYVSPVIPLQNSAKSGIALIRSL